MEFEFLPFGPSAVNTGCIFCEVFACKNSSLQNYPAMLGEQMNQSISGAVWDCTNSASIEQALPFLHKRLGYQW